MVQKGSILTNVMDIQGYVHQRLKVINVYENTLAVIDLNTKTTHVVHKIDIGMTSLTFKNKSHQYYQHFDLRATQKCKLPENEIKVKRWAF